MIYLDSAAVVKLVHRESRTAQLVAWLGAQAGVPLVSSVLVEVEVARALRRHAPGRLAAVPGTLARLHRFEINADIRAAAASLTNPLLRTLGAIHLATAVQLGSRLQSFVTYDTRLQDCAREAGLVVSSP